jgi:hypothetical protein
MTYREFKIKKKGKGFRSITAPDEELLKYQRSKLPQLEAFWQDIADEYGVDDIQHGFIKNRNCVTAASKHVGYKATISMDIADFFDNVNQNHIRHFSEILGNDIYLYHKEGHCSQGFATSPILCNIALLPAIAETNDNLYDYDDFAFTVYADDIQISVNEENYEELNKIIDMVENLFNKHGFQIKPQKTRIRYAKHGFRRILGVMVGDSSMKIPRKTRYKLRAARFQATNASTPKERRKAGNSAGGLTTWSRLELPRTLR